MLGGLRRLLGAAPIPLPFYLAGKVSLLGCWVSLVVRSLWLGLVWARNLGLEVAGAVLLITGLFLVAAGITGLGASARVGPPTEKTALKTRGIYRYTRNPTYLGGSSPTWPPSPGP